MSSPSVTPNGESHENLYLQGNQSNSISDSELAKRTNQLVLEEFEGRNPLNLESSVNLIAPANSPIPYNPEVDDTLSILQDLVWVFPEIAPFASAGITAWRIFSRRDPADFGEIFGRQLAYLEEKIRQSTNTDKLVGWKATLEATIDLIRNYANTLATINEDPEGLITLVQSLDIDSYIYALSTAFYEITGDSLFDSGEQKAYEVDEYFFAQAALSIAHEIYLNVLVLSSFRIKKNAILGVSGVALSESGLQPLVEVHQKFGNKYANAMRSFSHRTQSSLTRTGGATDDFAFVEWPGKREKEFYGMANVMFGSRVSASWMDYAVTTKEEQTERKLTSYGDFRLGTYEVQFVADCTGIRQVLFYDAEVKIVEGDLHAPRYSRSHVYEYGQGYFDSRRRVLNGIISEKTTMYNTIIENINSLIETFAMDLAPIHPDLSNVAVTFTNDHPEPGTYWAEANASVQYGFIYFDSTGRNSAISWTQPIPCAGKGEPTITLPSPDTPLVSVVRVYRKFNLEEKEHVVASHIRDPQSQQFPASWIDDFSAVKGSV